MSNKKSKGNINMSYNNEKNVVFKSDKIKILEDDAEMIIYFCGNTTEQNTAPKSNAYYTICHRVNSKMQNLQQKVCLEPNCSAYQAQFWSLVYALHAAVKLDIGITKDKFIIIRSNMLDVIIMSKLFFGNVTENVHKEAFKWIKYFPKVQFQWILKDILDENINKNIAEIQQKSINLTLSLRNNTNESTIISYVSTKAYTSDKTNFIQNFKSNIEISNNEVSITLDNNLINCTVNEKQVIKGSMISLDTVTTNISFHGISLDKGDLKQWKISLDTTKISDYETITRLKLHVPITFTLEFIPTYTQKSDNVVSFNFKIGNNNNNNNMFSIKKFISTICHSNDPIIQEMISKTSIPYRKKKRDTNKINNNNIIKGVPFKLSNQGKSNYIPLKNYDIPKYLMKQNATYGKLNNKDLNNRYEQIFLFDSSNNNNMKDYVDYYHLLLWLEEIQSQRDMIQFDIDNTTLTYEKLSNYFSLMVEGLSEKRPSILRGDVIIVSYKNKKYEGCIHKVDKNRIFLRFNPKFSNSYIQNDKCNVEFRYSSTLFRIYHQALDQINKINPNIINLINPKPQISSTIMVNTKILIQKFDKRLNDIQMFAINNILSNVNNPNKISSPYIIFGPPGTGKTSTMVEAIRQIGNYFNNSKILICAPSNTAANLLLHKLSESINPSEMFRYMSYHQEPSDISTDFNLLKYCLYDNQKNGYIFPNIDKFRSYKYIICTCSMAGKLYNYGIDLNHFNAIFIDESCYAFEPEIIGCFSSLLNMSTTNSSNDNNNSYNLFTGQLILSGDPKQLGPIIRSTYCSDSGGKLSISLLERLITMNPLYKCDLIQYPDTVGYNPKYITMLLDCYRCHKNILHIPNQLFYNNKLKCSIEYIDMLVDWEVLPKKGFPLLFHGVLGEHQREDTSPSWFNLQEIEMIWYYINELISTKKAKPIDIAIITPYYKQMKKLYELIKRKGKEIEYKDLLIGSCELMQGKERKIVIISTVRSSLEYLNKDIYYNLGFLSNPKRFNVAITRAKTLLIIIGNPNVLIKDKNWGNLLHYIKENGNCIGSPLTCNYTYDYLAQTCNINDELQNLYDNMINNKDDNDDCDFEINNNDELKSGEDL